jgi:P-type Ca2+ transporter type 2C
MYLFGATLVVIGLQLLAVYNPFMQKILHTTALEWADWMLIIPVAASVLFAEEARKLFVRRYFP